jgi:hypothetical protein
VSFEYVASIAIDLFQRAKSFLGLVLDVLSKNVEEREIMRLQRV